LFHNCLGGFLLFVRGIAVFTEDAMNEDADLGLGGLPQSAVNRHAFANMRHQFSLSESLVLSAPVCEICVPVYCGA
jgi:hypothetical protein